MITCSGVKFFDHGSVVLPVQVGKELLQVFRDLINENFTEFIVDGRFIPHISVFRKNTMDDNWDRVWMDTTLEFWSVKRLP